jgi:hypothetical protein
VVLALSTHPDDLRSATAGFECSTTDAILSFDQWKLPISIQLAVVLFVNNPKITGVDASDGCLYLHLAGL